MSALATGTYSSWKPLVTGSAAPDDTLSSPVKFEPADEWEKFANRLQEWLREPPVDDDEAKITMTALRSASALIPHLRQRGVWAPARLIPASDGGIALEWETDEGQKTVRIWAEGVAELICFANGHLASRNILFSPEQ